MKKKIIKYGMSAVLKTFSLIAWSPKLSLLNQSLSRKAARHVIISKGLKQCHELEELGQNWQKAFPSPKQVPLVNITKDTVYAEIHTPCPLRGTGNLEACYRMMEFDREVLRAIGGTFTVLYSQAEPGRVFCEVAMNFGSSAESSLVAAHLR